MRERKKYLCETVGWFHYSWGLELLSKFIDLEKNNLGGQGEKKKNK